MPELPPPPNTVQMRLDHPSTIYLKTGAGEKGLSVKLSAEEARSVARELIELSIRLDYDDPEEADKRDWVRIPMQYILVSAEQDPSFEHEELFPGAEVECWIKDQTWTNGLFVAKGWLEEDGWFINEVIDQVEVAREDYDPDDEGLKFYDQAVHDSQVFVYNVVSEDEDEEEGGGN